MDPRYTHFLVEVAAMHYRAGEDDPFTPADFKRLLRGFSDLLTDASIRRHPQAEEIGAYMTEHHRSPVEAAIAVAAVYRALAEASQARR